MFKKEANPDTYVNQIQTNIKREGRLRQFLEKYPMLFSSTTGKITGYQPRLYVKELKAEEDEIDNQEREEEVEKANEQHLL